MQIKNLKGQLIQPNKYETLSGINLRYSDLHGADLRGANLQNIKLNKDTFINETTLIDAEQLTYLILKGLT